jgi:adenine deaminase
MNVQETWIKGRKVFTDGKVLFKYTAGNAVNNFNCQPISETDIRVKNRNGEIRIIGATDGELLTSQIHGFAGSS